MNGNQNQRNMGEQIKDALADALQSGDFKMLNDLVTQTVTDTLNEVGRHIADVVPPQDISVWKQKAGERKKQEENRREQQEQMRRRQEEERRGQEQFRSRQSSAKIPAVRKNSVGKVSGVLYQVFGGIGMGIAGLAMCVRLFLFMIGALGKPADLLIILAFMAGFAGIIGVGIGKGKRLKRADRYIALCGAKMYGDVAKLAEETGKSCNYVRRDIGRMLKAGIFPEGHLDERKTCFMLSDAVYRQYLEAEENRRIREEAEKKTVVPEQEDDRREITGENELNAMMAEGMDCIRRLRELNDNIEGEVISGKLSRLENLLKEIFDSVREHPEQMHRMHKPMDYYLPTTLKLVEAYEEFDGISVPGDEVLQAKAEIEKTLDTINEAFAELLNNLFRDAVFDATADAQVLKSMLAREGLAKEMEFTKEGQMQDKNPQR